MTIDARGGSERCGAPDPLTADIPSRSNFGAEVVRDMAVLAEDAVAAGVSPPAMCCRHCDAVDIWRWGRADNGRQRWRCRNCHRTFSARTNTALAGLRNPGLFARLLDDMAAPKPLSCRGLAGQLGVDRMTVWHWRRKAMGLLGQGCQPEGANVLVVRESRKASREWVNHRLHPDRFPKPDRLRWMDYPRLGIPAPDWLDRYRIKLAAVLDTTGTCMAAILPAPCAHRFFEPCTDVSGGALRQPQERERSTLTRDQEVPPRQASDGGAATAERRPGATDAATDNAVAAPSLRLSLRRFLRPFRGPATRHLAGYLNWFAARVDGSLASMFNEQFVDPNR